MSDNALSTSPYPRMAASSRDRETDEITALDLVNLGLRHRWRLAAFALLCGALYVLPVLFRAPTYTATASFILQGSENGRAGLAGLAGQLGMALPAAGGGQSPQFFADLLSSRELLGRIADDSFSVTPNGGKRVPFVEMFAVEGATPTLRRERAVILLDEHVLEHRLSKTTGVVTVLATSEWPEVSTQIVQRALDGLNDFTLRMRQSQAAADRRYSEERVEASRDALRRAENRLQAFLQANRRWQGSPQLTFEHERLQREVALQLQVYTAAAETNEEARARETRETPVITLVDSPTVPAHPNARGRVRRAVVGVLVGAFAGFLIALGAHVVARRRRAGDPDAERFDALLGEVRRDLTRWMPLRRRLRAPDAH